MLKHAQLCIVWPHRAILKCGEMISLLNIAKAITLNIILVLLEADRLNTWLLWKQLDFRPFAIQKNNIISQSLYI